MEEKVIAFFAEKLSLSAEEISSDTVLTDIGADSMTLLTLLLDFEAEFNVQISDRDIENLVVVGDLIHLVSGKKKGSL